MDKLVTGLQITLIGMGVVFIILLVLYGAMVMMERFFQRGSGGKEPRPAQPHSWPPERTQAPSAKEPEPPIAVITAAIAAAQGLDRPFRITSIRFTTGAHSPQWRRAGIGDNVRQSG